MELKQIISEIESLNVKAVSFDMFDTLVYRPVINPSDLFKLMGLKNGYGKNFYFMRVNAEKHAAQNRANSMETITIDEIYDSMKLLYSISDVEIDRIKSIELQTEYKYILPRKTMVELFNTLRENGKKVIITTDMYLPSEFLQKVLINVGIEKYDNLIVSCEWGKSKRTGNLYKVLIDYCKENGISEQEIVHVGDNKTVDINMALQNGLKSYYFPSAINRFKSIKGLDKITKIIDSNLDNSFMVGYIANYLFDNPLKDYNKDTIANGEWSNATTLTIAPMLFIFCKWMLEDCVKNNTQKLFCVYRDGFIPEKILDVLKQAYKSNLITQKLFINRAMMYCFYAENENALFEAIKDIPVDPDMTVDTFICNRILVNEINVVEYEEVLEVFKKYGATDKDSRIGDVNCDTTTIWRELDPYFKRHAEKIAEATDRYITEQLKDENNYAIFDIGYRGRVGKFLANRYGYQFTGYHFCAKSELQMANKNNAQTKALIQRGLDVLKTSKLTYVLLDDVVSVQAPGMNKVHLVDGKIEFVYEREQEFSSEIEQIQQQIVLFTTNIVNVFGDDLELLNFDVYPFYDLYTSLLSNGITRKDVEMFKFMRSPNDTCLIRLSETDYYREWFKEIVGMYNKKVDEINSARIKEESVTKSKFIDKIYGKMMRNNKTFLQVYYKTVRKLLEKLKIKSHISGAAYEMIFDMADIIKNQTKYGIIHMKKVAKEQNALENKPVVACFGEIIENKGLGECIKNWNLHNVDCSFIYFRESIEKDLLPCTVCDIPQFLYRNKILNYEGKKIKVSRKIARIVNKTPYLYNAFLNISKKNSTVPQEYFYLYVYWADKYVKQMLDYVKPESVIIWLQFYPYHEIIEENCKLRNIKTYFFEFGVLPGTYSIETVGQMGRSYPATNYEEFRNTQVNIDEIKYATEVVEYIKGQNLKRWDDNSDAEIEKVMSKIKGDRPVVLFAGQNDFESGMYPYNEKAKMYHSPIFETSNEAAFYLAKIAEKYDWNFIYKPHPAMLKTEYINENDMPSNVLLLKSGDINKVIDTVDLTITILSQVAYVSLLRDKPVMLLGYTQLRGKDCSYEAFKMSEIEQTLVTAVNEKYTSTMKENFIIHVAQVLKGYVYDDTKHNDFPYGLSCKNAISNMYKHNEKNESAQDCVSRYIEQKNKGKVIWENILNQYNINPCMYKFIYFPSFDVELNELALDNIDKVFNDNDRVIVISGNKSVLKNAHCHSSKVKRSIYLNKFDGDCLMAYYSSTNFEKNFYVVSLDKPYGRNVKHMVEKKKITLEELVIGGILNQKL